MSIFSRLLRDSSSPNTLSNREKRLRRRRFLKGLEDHSRSMRMEQLEPRLLLAGDFIEAGRLEIHKEGGYAGAIPEFDESTSYVDMGVFYVAQKGGDKVLKVENAILEYDHNTNVIEFKGSGGGNADTFAKAKGNWELLTSGSWTIKNGSLKTEEVVAVDTIDYLDFMDVFDFTADSFGVAPTAVTVQGNYVLDVGAGLSPFASMVVDDPLFSIEDKNYWNIGRSGRWLTRDISLDLPSLDFHLIPGQTGAGDPKITLTDPKISYHASLDVIRLTGEVALENVWKDITITGDLQGDDDAPKYIQLSKATGSGIKVDTVASVTVDPFDIGKLTVGGVLELDTVNGNYKGELTVDSPIGEFQGVAQLVDGALKTVALSYQQQWQLGTSPVYFQQALIGLTDLDSDVVSNRKALIGAEVSLGPTLSMTVPDELTGDGDKSGQLTLAKLALAAEFAPFDEFCSLSTSISVPSELEDWFDGKPTTTGLEILSGSVGSEDFALITSDLDLTYNWCKKTIKGTASVEVGDDLANGTMTIDVSMAPRLKVKVNGSATVDVAEFSSKLAFLGKPTGQVSFQYHNNDKDHIAVWYVDSDGDEWGAVYYFQQNDVDLWLNGWWADSSITGGAEHTPGTSPPSSSDFDYSGEAVQGIVFYVNSELDPAFDEALIPDLIDTLVLTDVDDGTTVALDNSDPDFAITIIEPTTTIPPVADYSIGVKLTPKHGGVNVNRHWRLESVDVAPHGPHGRHNFDIGAWGITNQTASFDSLTISPSNEITYSTSPIDTNFQVDFVAINTVDETEIYLTSSTDASGTIAIDDSDIPKGTYKVVAALHDLTGSAPEEENVRHAPVEIDSSDTGQTFTVTNHSPAFDYVGSGDQQLVTPGELDVMLEGNQYFEFDLVATDIDGDDLTFGSPTLQNGSPYVLAEVDAVTGRVTVYQDYTMLGPYTETFFIDVSDGTDVIPVKINANIVPDGRSPSDIVQALNSIGHKIQDYAEQLNLPDGIPFVSDAISQTVDFTEKFHALTEELSNDPQLKLVHGDDIGNWTFGSETYLVQIDGSSVVELNLDTGSVSDSTGLISALDLAISNAGAVDLLDADLDDDGWVIIKPVDEGVHDRLLVSDLYHYGNAPIVILPENGQLASDLDLTISSRYSDTDQTLTTGEDYVFDLQLAAADTLENDSVEDLLKQLQAKIPTGLSSSGSPAPIELGVKNDGGGSSLVIISTSKREYVELTVEDNTAGTLATTQRPIDDDLRLNLGPQLAVYTFNFETVDELATAINTYLPISDVVTVSYDEVSHELMFELELGFEWNVDVPLDFTKGVSLGSLGTLDVVGEGDVEVDLSAVLDATVGIDLTPGGRNVPLDRGTDLISLNNYDGIRIDASLPAENVPPGFVLSHDVQLDIEVVGAYDGADPEHTRFVAIIPAASTTGNSDIYTLAEDVNAAIQEALNEGLYESSISASVSADGKIILTNSNASVTRIILKSTDTVNESLLGFDFDGATELISGLTDVVFTVTDHLSEHVQIVDGNQESLGEAPVWGTNESGFVVVPQGAPDDEALKPFLYEIVRSEDPAPYSYTLHLDYDVLSDTNDDGSSDIDFEIKYPFVDVPVTREFYVTLDGVKNIGDVISAFETAVEDGGTEVLGDYLEIGLNPFSGLTFESVYEFQISSADSLVDDLSPILSSNSGDDSGSLSTAEALGIVMTTGSRLIEPTVVGNGHVSVLDKYGHSGLALDDRPLHHRIFIEEPQLGVDAPTVSINGTLTATPSIVASWGIMEAVGSLDLGVTADLDISLRDPAYRAADGKIYLDELTNSNLDMLLDGPNYSLTVEDADGGDPANLNLSLGVLGTPVAQVLVQANTVPGIEIGDEGWLTFSADTTTLEDLSELTVDQIILAVKEGVNFLKSKADGSDPDWDWLNEDLPVVNRSAADGLDFLDTVLIKLDELVYGLDLEQINAKIGEIQSLVHNLPDQVDDKSGVSFDLSSRIKDRLNTGISFLQSATTLDEDRVLSRLIASSTFLQSLIGEYVDPTSGTDVTSLGELLPTFDELLGEYSWTFGTDTFTFSDTHSLPNMVNDIQQAISDLKDLIPSMSNLVERLGEKVSEEVCLTFYSTEDCIPSHNPFDIDFQLADLDGDEANDTVLVGLRFDPPGPILHERFTPHLDVADYGPIAIDVDGDMALTVDGFVQLSMGIGKGADGLESFLITDGNAPIAPTAVQFSTSVLGEVKASVGFGALEALKGTVGLSIAEAVKEELTVDYSNTIDLLAAPLPASDNGYYLFIFDNSTTPEPTLVSSDDYSVSGTEVTFDNLNAATSVTVYYNTEEIQPLEEIPNGLDIGDQSDVFYPQGGTAAKIHLVKGSEAPEVVSEEHYQLVEAGGGIKIEALSDLRDSEGLHFSYMEEILFKPAVPLLNQPHGTVPLTEVPLYGTNRNLNGAEDEQFRVYATGTTDPVDFDLITNDGVNYSVEIADAGASGYDVFYPTRDTFFDGQGPASIYFDLNNPDADVADAVNNLGGINFDDLIDLGPTALNLITSGFVTANMGATLFGSTETPDVAYAAGMMTGESGELADTEFEFRAGIDAEALNNMLSNIDFNLKTIIQGLEAFLELLETGMRDETLAKLPFIDSEDLTGPADFVQRLREGFVTPLKERLCKAGGQPLSVLEGELAGWIFSALGPGMTSDSIAFESLFADLASELESEPDWLIEDGLNLIDMSQFRFSDQQKSTIEDVEGLSPISLDKDVAFGQLKDHLTDINAGDTYVYKQLGDDWLEIPIAQEDHYSFFKAIVPITFGEEGDKFEIGDIGVFDNAELVGGGTARIGNIPLGRTYSETVEFKNSLDSLPFEVQGEPEINFDLHFGFDLGVGVDKSSGFYFITNDEDSAAHQGKELEIGFEAALGEDSSMGIDLFGLMLQAENDGTELSASIGIDISDINTDDHLTLSEIGSNEFFDWFRPEIEFKADLGLVFSAGINSNIPSISTRLGADLDFEIYLDTSNQFQTDFSKGKFEFTDVQLDLGDFLTKTIGPILKEVDKVLDPVKPIVDFLTMEVPGISDASEFAGKGKVMVMDLAFTKDPEMGEKARKFVGVVQQIMDVVEMLASFEEGESMAIEFGSFEFDQTSNPTVDMLNEPFPSDLENTLDLSNVESAENVTEQANNGSNATVSAGFAKVDEDPGPLGLAGLGIQLDIIKDPMNIVKLLMGQTANLVSWDIPRFDLNFEYTKSFPIWATPPISLGIGADFGLFADFSVGMDTRFRQTGNFLDGFYFGDLEGVHTGADIAELGITIGARLRAALDLLIVSAGVEGELRAEIEANWADTNDDGKMYLDEMANIIRQDGFECLFEISGRLRALISIFYEVDVWFWSSSGSKTLADILLYEFELAHCPKWRLAHIAENGEVQFETPAGEELSSGTDWLIIHAGQFGDMRGGSSSDTHEYFELNYEQGSQNELIIEFNHGDVIQSITTEMDGIDTIYFDGGYGSDTLKLTGDWPADMRILFDGGIDSDKIEMIDDDDLGGIALGGSGNDQLLVSAGTVAWELWGGAGTDKIEGSAAGDAIFGGDAADKIYAGPGGDFVDAGAGNDEVYAFVPTADDGSADYVRGGAGADRIWTGDGNDQVDAGPGNDVVYAGAGDDKIFGAAGHDDLYGEAGADTIIGGSGNDDLVGWVYIDASNKTRPELNADFSDGTSHELNYSLATGIFSFVGTAPNFGASDDNDEIAGQDGDDVILGYSGDDILAGGGGNDFIVGYRGHEDATEEEYENGDRDPEKFYGGFGDDILIAHVLGNVDSANPHEMYGGPGDDYFCGSHGVDAIYGGTRIESNTTYINDDGVLSLEPVITSTFNSGVPAEFDSKPWVDEYPEQEYEILPADLEDPPADIGATLDRPVCHVVVLDNNTVAPEIIEALVPVTTTSLTGFVYLDANEDQQRGDDESGIAEILVQLQDRDGQIVLETVSGEDGSYGFDNVDQGEYSIVQILDASGVYLQTSPPNEHSDQHVYDVVVSADDQEFGSLDFGNRLEGVKIEGRKLRIDSSARYLVETYWFEQMVATQRAEDVPDFVPESALMSAVSPFRGIETSVTEGINGWEIYLYDTDWNLLDSTHTSSIEKNGIEGIQPEELGWYEFDHLPYGQYIVSEQYRPGWAQVVPPLYFDNAITPVKDDGYSWTNSYAQVGQLPYQHTAIELEMNVHHDNVGELHMWLETPGDGVNPGVRVPLTWTSQRDIQDRRTAEYRGYGFGVAQRDLLDLEDLGSTKFINIGGAGDIEIAGALGVTEVSSSELSSPVNPLDLSATTEIASKYKLDLPPDSTNPLQVAGQWRLIIEDVDQGNAGELLDWTLHFYGGEDEKTSYPGGVNRNPIQSAGVRTSYVVDMSAPEETAMMPDGVEGKMAISLGPSGPYYHFGNYELVGDISGTKWHDADGDGKQGDNEPGVSGVKIYLDQNGNGQWDYTDSNLNGQWDTNPPENHEPFVYTDAEGNYTFVNVPIGEHTVREDTTDYWQTYPHLLYSENFEGEINTQYDATWYSDTAAQDTLHPHLAPSGVTSFLGDFENDKVELRLNDLPKHQNLRVGFDVYVLGSWDGNHQHQGGDQFRFSANGSPYLVDTSFSNHGGVVGDSDTTISWQNPDNPFDVEVTTTPGIVTEKDTETLFDYVVKHGAIDLSIADSNAITSQGYLDVTGDGFISPRDIISVFNFVNAAAEAEEDSASQDEDNLGFTQSFGLDDMQQPILLATDQQFAPRMGAARAIDFGNHSADRPLPLEILPGIPAHNTLGYDMYGRNAQQTDQFLPADTTYHFEIEINHDASDLVLEFEALGLTNDGKTNFEKWGIDNIRVLMDHHVVTVQPDQVVTDVDFGNQELPDYSVSGTKYLKVRETQIPLSGVTIYADLNNNDQWDEGEPKDVTRADDPEVPGNQEGTYHLTGIRQAPVTIREMPYGAIGPLLPLGGEHFVTFEKDPHAQGYDFLNARFGSVSGLKWHDANADGKYTAGEEFLEGVNIGLDLDSDGSIDEVTQTDSTGHYLFHYVRPGDHQVVEYVPSGWEPTLPADGKISFSNEIGENVSNLNFGNQRIQVVTGTKYIPGEQGGKDNHVGAAGFTIYADLNDNQNLDQGEPSTQTLHDNPLTDRNEAGFYQLSGFGDRTSVVIRELEKSDWLLVSPEGGRHIVDLSDGVDKTGVDFLNVPTGIVSGFKWHDLDADGVWSAKEPPINDWQITIDVNGDDKVDFITITDSNGYYEASVPAGTVTIGEILPSPWRQTYPVENGKHTVHVNHGMHLKDLNFGNINPEQQGEGDGKVKVFTGVLFHDVNNDGKLDPNVDAPLNNWTVYADLNKNDLLDNADLQVKSSQSGEFRIELDAGEITELGIRVAAPQGWIVSSPTNGEYLLDVSENDLFGELNFLSVEGATVSGHKWGDENLDARWDGDEKGLSGWEIRIDLGSDGDGGYDLSTVTNESGYYEFSNLPSGTHRIFEVHQEGWHQTAPETVSHTVSVTPGKTYSDRNFGNFQQIVITGKKTDKSTGNGVAGVIIYADLNSDGDRDPGEPMAVTANDVPATTAIDETGDYKLYVMRHDSLKIREVVPAGWTLSEPSTGHHDLDTRTVSRIENVNFVNVQDSGSISGSKWNDLDGDGVWDENEPALSGWTIQLDIGQNGTVDQTVVTNSEGNYSFTGLDAGRYQVSEDQKQGWKRTFPLEPAHPVTLATGQSVVGINFGNQLDDPAGSIAGTKWNDVDADGIWDAGEPRLQGWVIQLDIGRDGKVDRTTTTDANGDYVFRDLAAGVYQVLEVQQPGWEQTFPLELAHPVNLAAGQNVIHVNFGNHQDCEVHGRKTGIHGDVGIPGVQIYADINGNGQYDPNEPATLTSFDDPATDKDETGFYSLTGLPCNPVTIREILPAGWAVYSPDNGKHDVDFGNRPIVTDLDFRNYKLGTIYGYKRYDSDVELEGLFAADGSLDKGLDGWEIQIDYNWGGTGSVFVVDATVVTRADDPDTGVDEEGLYVFDNVPPGMHLIREVLKPGWTQTFPLSGEKENGRNYIVNIVGSEVKGSYDFGNVSELTVHGRKLDYENPEQGLAGFVIYADSNDNGVLDEGEVSTTTASDGSYTLTGIDQNTVNIREVQQEDYLQRYPEDAHSVNFSVSTTTVRELNFLNQSILLVPDGDDEIHIFGGEDSVFGDNEIDKTDPDFEKFVSTGSRNDTYVFEQVLAKNGTSASVGNEIDYLHDYQEEGFDTFTFETLYNYYGYGDGTLAGINNPSVSLDLASVNPAPVPPFNIHQIAGGNERTIHFENHDENHIERIVGSTEDDHLIGNERQQILVGHLGSDTLEARGENDTYKFYNNFEVVDTVSGITGITGVTLEPSVVGPETDVIAEATGEGRDELDLADLANWSDIVVDLSTAGGQHEMIDGGHLRSFDFQGDQSLEVFITGIVTDASVTGNDESQTFIGGGTGTTIFDGRAGDDSFIINAGAAGGVIQVDGGAGDDTVDFSQFDANFVHQMNGSSSSSESPDGTVMTFEEVEFLSGSQGDDYVHFLDAGGFAFGAGEIYGNAGLNTLDYSAFPGTPPVGGFVVSVDLNDGTATGTASATDFDDVIGSQFPDELIGSDGANRIVGGPGNDILSGGDGPDTYEFEDDGVVGENDEILELGSLIFSTNIIDLRTTMEDVSVDGGAGSIVQGSQRTVNVAGMDNIGELRTGSGNDVIELWDTADAGFMYSWPLVDLHWWSDGLRVYGGEGDDTYVVPNGYSTQVGIIESFDPIDPATDEVIPSSDTLDLSAILAPTMISLNEFTAVDPFAAGYAIRLYDTNSSEAGTIGSVDLEGYSLFENVITGSGDDIIFGNDGDNLIDSGNGSDVVYGLAGADEIVVHGANGETNLVAGGAGHDLYRLQGDFSSGPDNRIFEAGASMTPGTGKLTPGGNDTIELDALGINCVYVNLQGDVTEEVTDCHGGPTSIAAGTVGVASPGLAYREVLSLHGELMPIVDFDTIHSIHDVQTEISTSGDIYDSNGRFVENVLGTSTGQNWIWANGADNILTGGQQADTFTAIRGGDHFIYGAEGNDSMLLGPTGFASHLNTSGKGILFEADGVIPIADLDGAIVLVVDTTGVGEAQFYEFDNDSDVSAGVQAIAIGSYPTAMEIAESDFDEDQILGYAISKLRDAIHNDFTRYDADPTTPEPSVELVGAGLGLPGEEIVVLATGGITNNVRIYDLDHLYEHQAGERVIGNNVLIGGDGMDSMISHDGSDLILADEADLSFLGLYSTGEKLEFINELNNIWRADDDSAETRLDEMLALLNTESGYAHSSLNDYLTDDGDVDTVRLDSDYEIDLPDDEWSKGVDVFFGTVPQDQIIDDVDEDDLINGLP